MNPFFFGNSSHPLYGVFHPPAHPVKHKGVLLCAPFGQEYMRSHRAYRQLAMLLAKKGFHVLRFDYRGTGDSSGDIENTSIKDWIEDVSTAAEELRETANVTDIHVVGLRLGGLLACAANLEGLRIDKLALWDTVVSGKNYDDELLLEMSKEGASRCNQVDNAGTLHFNGFPLHRDKRDALEELSLTQMKPDIGSVLHIVSAESESASALKNSWQSNPAFTYQLTPAPGDWNYVDQYGGILLPQPIIQATVNWLEQE